MTQIIHNYAGIKNFPYTEHFVQECDVNSFHTFS